MTSSASASSPSENLIRDGRLGGMPGRALLAAVAAAGIAVVLAGCGGTAPSVAASSGSSGPGSGAPDPNATEVNAAGDIPDSQVFVPFSLPGGGFTVSVPQGWARSGSGQSAVFTDKFNSVRLESQSSATAPDVASVKAHEVPALQASVPGFAVGNVTTVNRPGGQAVLVSYEASSGPDPVTGKSVTEAVQRYEFWRAGREALVTLSGPKGADNVDPWLKITESFRWQ